MLDDLLGRTELKEEIAELTAEVERLENQLASADRRRAEAVTAKQEAEQRVNRLEDRIEQLEDRIDRLQSAEGGHSFRRTEDLAGDRLVEVLDRLDGVATGPEGALTAYVADGRELPAALRDLFGDRAALVARAAPCLVVADDAELVAACLRPVVAPDPFLGWAESFRVDRGWFRPQGRYTLALVRSDLFAMGTYQGDERVAFHGFDSQLKSQHSKGGFSQARFERLRDEQIDEHLDRCRAAVAERDADPLYVVGEASLLGEFEDVAAVTSAVDATGDPEEALRTAWSEFWTVQFWVL